MAERHHLRDLVDVTFVNEGSSGETATAFRTFSLEKMAFAWAGAQYFAAGCNLETFGRSFLGFNTFWSSHKKIVRSLKKSAKYRLGILRNQEVI
ncbi:MAG: hypothetical protein JWM68_4849 [Verrucomicrobiales bacterium]|nr:hypothetical protein [Verrucomicrobiales bacterium]